MSHGKEHCHEESAYQVDDELVVIPKPYYCAYQVFAKLARYLTHIVDTKLMLS